MRIATERYRLALIAHHARMLAELIEGHTINRDSIAAYCEDDFYIDANNLRDLAVEIEEHLNLNSKETHE